MGLVSVKTSAALAPAGVIAVAAGLLAAMACGSFDEAAPVEGPDASAADAPSGSDSDSDAGDAGCTLLVEDSFDDMTASNARWRVLGSASISGGEAELVPDQTGQKGAIWMNVQNAPPGRLHVRFTSKIAPANGSDGLTFTWSANQDVGLGGTAGDYGVCGGGAEGLAFVLASFGKTVRLIDDLDGCKGDAGIPANVFNTNAVELSATGDRVDVTIADKPFEFASPRAVQVRSVGFTASTGGGKARHAVDDVRVEICP